MTVFVAGGALSATRPSSMIPLPKVGPDASLPGALPECSWHNCARSNILYSAACGPVPTSGRHRFAPAVPCATGYPESFPWLIAGPDLASYSARSCAGLPPARCVAALLARAAVRFHVVVADVKGEERRDPEALPFPCVSRIFRPSAFAPHLRRFPMTRSIKSVHSVSDSQGALSRAHAGICWRGSPNCAR